MNMYFKNLNVGQLGTNSGTALLFLEVLQKGTNEYNQQCGGNRLSNHGRGGGTFCFPKFGIETLQSDFVDFVGVEVVAAGRL